MSATGPVCDIDGEPVNPNNGRTTAGKTGLMRWRDTEGGPVVREQEISNGVLIGAVRHYNNGQLQREYGLNERGNVDGLLREYDGQQLLVEENFRDGKAVGLARRWYADGTLKRVNFNGDDGRPLAEAAFTTKGQLRDLRCGDKPLLGPDADDAAWCGHGIGPGSVTLHAESGQPVRTLVYERGELRKSETLWGNGKPSSQVESTADGRIEREFSEAGVKLHERRWTATERGNQLQLEQRWYLNGQLKETSAYEEADGQRVRRDTQFHDNGRIASEGVWAPGRYSERALGVHKRYDAEGRLQLELHHDDKGSVTREREFDKAGQLLRDDELFADGSRKAFQAGQRR